MCSGETFWLRPAFSFSSMYFWSPGWGGQLALYIVVISVASLFIGPRGAMITSVGSVAAFNACALLAINGIGPINASTTEESIASTIQALGLSDVSFLVVGLLAAKLAERQSRSDVQLAATTQTLANLRALHERIVESMRAAASGRASPRFEADCLAPDGLVLRLGFSIAPLFAESGETSGMVITFQDLTDVRAMEETS